MADWLDERIAHFLEQRDAEHQARRPAAELEAHKADVLRVKARPLLDDLTAQVQHDFERYDGNFHDEPERQVRFTPKPAGGFKLSKAHYPAVDMECSLDLATRAIKAEYTMLSTAHGTPHHQTIDVFLDVDTRDHVVINVGKHRVRSLGDLSRILIERVLFA
jgi:hypothetical protein